MVRSELASVIIPCYRQAHFLADAIESVLAQSYTPVEIVVVDDGSPDHTAEVAARYPGARLVRQRNQGLAAARNAGVRHSTGAYLVFLDADDRLLPHAIQTGVDHLRVRPACAFVVGGHRKIARDGSPSGHDVVPAPVGDPYLELLRFNFVGVPAAAVCRRDHFPEEGFSGSPAVRMAEDYRLWLQCARRAPVHCHGTVVAEYREHESSGSRNHALMLRSTTRVLRMEQPYLPADPRYHEAYRSGLRTWRHWYGEQLAHDIRMRLRTPGSRGGLIRDLATLLRHHPAGLAAHALRKLRNLRPAAGVPETGPVPHAGAHASAPLPDSAERPGRRGVQGRDAARELSTSPPGPWRFAP